LFGLWKRAKKRYDDPIILHPLCVMVVKVIEVVGISSSGFEDALREVVSRTAKTVKHVTGVDIVGQNAKVKDGAIVEYHVNAKIAFVVEE